MRISDWSSDVCSSDLFVPGALGGRLCRLRRHWPEHPARPFALLELRAAGGRCVGRSVRIARGAFIAMRSGFGAEGALACLALANCTGPSPPALPSSPLPPPVAIRPIETVDDDAFAFQGALMQGGYAIGQAPPGTVKVKQIGRAHV